MTNIMTSPKNNNMITMINIMTTNQISRQISPSPPLFDDVWMLSKVPVPPLEHAPKLEHSHANTSHIPLASHHCLANRDSQNDPIVMPVSVKE